MLKAEATAALEVSIEAQQLEVSASELALVSTVRHSYDHQLRLVCPDHCCAFGGKSCAWGHQHIKISVITDSLATSLNLQQV